MTFYQPPVMRTVSTVTASTLSPGIADSGTLYVIDRAAGVTVTLPAIDSGEIGVNYRFHIKTTITSNSFKIQVPSASEAMSGTAFVISDDTAAGKGFATASTSDTITMNGSTTGGIAGDTIMVTALSTTLWGVRVLMSATGTEATPFSAAVS